MENYPQLKSNENFLRLQDELAGTENRIAVERKRYNDTLQDYNTYVSSFPTAFLRRGPDSSRMRHTSGVGGIAAGSEGEFRAQYRAAGQTAAGAGALEDR